MKNKNKAEGNTAQDVAYEAGIIAEGFFSATCQHEEWSEASEVLCRLVENIATPESLRNLGDLLHEIASESERLTTDAEHEAETTERLCNAISKNLSAKYDKFVGRA